MVDLDDVPSVTLLSTDSRAWRAYAPGKVQLNGLYYPATTLGDLALTWAHRNRLTQKELNEIVSQAAASIAGGPEGDVRVERFVGGVLKEDYGLLSGTSINYTAADRVADDADGSKSVYFRFTPQGALEGYPRTTEPVVMTGLGMVLGLYLGGVEA